MSINKYLIALILFLTGTGVVFLLLIPRDYHTSPIYSGVYGEIYVVRIPNELIGKSPSWVHGMFEPPLSRQRAIELADEVYHSFVQVKLDDAEGYHWELGDAIERQAGGDKWFWCVYYHHFTPVLFGYPEELVVVVLMDGTVLKPELIGN
jgi:hypothetical protein